LLSSSDLTTSKKETYRCGWLDEVVAAITCGKRSLQFPCNYLEPVLVNDRFYREKGGEKRALFSVPA
jgi:hypothetical protein